jgi:hypothetical protein
MGMVGGLDMSLIRGRKGRGDKEMDEGSGTGRRVFRPISNPGLS